METHPLLFLPQSSSSSSTMVSNTQLFGSFYGGGGTSGAHEVHDHKAASPSTMQSHGGASSSRMELPTANGSKDVDVEAKPSKKKAEKKVRKHRYAFQTRSQVDILDDGYRWRKYGQKAVKNNKFPRSYYRCTHQGCNVKKQVQRLSKDEGVVVTTYEGMHTHPIEKSNDNFEHILNQMQIYSSF